MAKAVQKTCDHPEYIFDYQIKDHVCEVCRMRWRDTGKPAESSNYVFDRLLGNGC